MNENANGSLSPIIIPDNPEFKRRWLLFSIWKRFETCLETHLLTWWPLGKRLAGPSQWHRCLFKAIGLQLADTASRFCKLSYSGMWADGLKWEWNYWSAGLVEMMHMDYFGGRGEFAAVQNIMLRDVVKLFKNQLNIGSKPKWLLHLMTSALHEQKYIGLCTAAVDVGWL